MKKFPRTKARSRLGVAFVERVVFEAGSIFRSIPEETDLGIDGYIEFVENEVAAGTLVGVPIKTGSSYLRNFADGQYFQVDVSRRDLNYWHIQPIPIALIAFDPESNLSGWLDVTGYIRNNTDALQREHTSLTINCRSSFDVSTFVTEFKSTFENYRSEGNLFSLADLVVSDDSDKKLRGLIGLLQHNTSRFSRLTCLLLLQHLFYPNDRLRATVADALSRYLPHPEVGFIPPPHIRDYVEAEIGKYGRQQIAELLDIA